MPSSADPAQDAVVRAIIALERSCLDAEAALAAGDAATVAVAFDAQVRLTAELGALFAAAPRLAPANDARVAQRLEGIVAYRDGQLTRLRQRRDDLRERLAAIGKVNAFSRSFRTGTRTAHVLDGQY